MGTLKGRENGNYGKFFVLQIFNIRKMVQLEILEIVLSFGILNLYQLLFNIWENNI